MDYNGSTLFILHNTGEDEIVIDLSKYHAYEYNKIVEVIGFGQATLEGTTLTIAPKTSIIIK